MSRYKNKRESVQIFGVDEKAIEALRSDELWGGSFTPMKGKGVKGFTIGNAIHPPMYEGEGLPAIKPGWREFPDSAMTFELQIRFKAPDAFEICFAEKGTNRHFIFPYEGLPTKRQGRVNDAVLAAYEFCWEVDDWLADTVSFLFYARSMRYTDRKKQKEALDEVLSILKKKFKEILIWVRRRPVATREPGESKTTPLPANADIPPGKIVIVVPVEVGRPPGTKGKRTLSAKENEKRLKRKPLIIDAMRNATNNENKAELSRIIGITTPTLRNWLGSIGASKGRAFYDLIREAESN